GFGLATRVHGDENGVLRCVGVHTPRPLRVLSGMTALAALGVEQRIAIVERGVGSSVRSCIVPRIVAPIVTIRGVVRLATREGRAQQARSDARTACAPSVHT